MHKLGKSMLILAAVIPLAVIACAPAGSATTGLTCTKLTGKVTWSPPVPKTTAAKSNITLKASLSGCTGTPKITSGVIALPVIKGTVKQTCTTLVTKPVKLTQKGGSITWSTTKTKSMLGVLTLAPAGVALYKATAKVASGQFMNKTLTVTGKFIPGACPFKSATVSIKPGTKGTIK